MNTRFNLPLVCNIVCKVLIIEAITIAVAVVIALCYAEADWVALAISGAITGAVGLVGWAMTRRAPIAMTVKSGILTTAVAWLAVALFGSLPFVLCTHPVRFTHALFESMSGFTTTGASVLTDIDNLGYGMNMWRALMQWIGGIGIIVFSLVLFPKLNQSGGMKLMAAESVDFAIDKTSPRIANTARSLGLVYLTLTVCCLVCLWLGPMNLYEAVTHAFCTVSTGGFSPYAAGIGHYNSLYIKIVLIVFMFLAAVNFTLLVLLGRGNWRATWRNATLRLYVGTVILFWLLAMGALALSSHTYSTQEGVVDTLFQIMSTISSTGFSTVDFELWGPLVLLLLFILMYTGACAGSTCGGIKLDRLRVFFQNCRNQIAMSINRNAVYNVTDGSRVIANNAISRILSFMLMYALTLLVGGLIIAAMGVGVRDAFFAVFSCTSNVGLGYGITGAQGSYSLLPDAALWVLTFMMFLGRLELMTVIVLFLPSFWQK